MRVICYTGQQSLGDGRTSASTCLSEQWRLFIDSSKVSLKAVLLRDGNKHLEIPLVPASHMKETCANLHGMLKKK